MRVASVCLLQLVRTRRKDRESVSDQNTKTSNFRQLDPQDILMGKRTHGLCTRVFGGLWRVHEWSPGWTPAPIAVPLESRAIDVDVHAL